MICSHQVFHISYPDDSWVTFNGNSSKRTRDVCVMFSRRPESIQFCLPVVITNTTLLLDFGFLLRDVPPPKIKPPGNGPQNEWDDHQTNLLSNRQNFAASRINYLGNQTTAFHNPFLLVDLWSLGTLSLLVSWSFGPLVLW